MIGKPRHSRPGALFLVSVIFQIGSHPNLSLGLLASRFKPHHQHKHTLRLSPTLILTQTLESSNLSINLSICSIFSGESMAEPGVQSESLMEKIYGHHRSSSSSSSDDDKPAKLHDAVKPKVDDNKPSAHDSVKSNIFRIFGREKPVHKVLGGGKPADVLLWRDKKISASVLGVATGLWIFFELLEYHLITLVCHTLILFLGVFFLWSNGSSFINKAPPQIPNVQIPEKCVLDLASALRIELNKGFHVLRDIASGRDLKTFLGVIAVLWIMSVIGKWFNFLTLFYLTFVLLHTVPVIYEKYDVQIDAFAEKAWIEFKKQYAVFDAKVLSKIPKGPVKEKKKD